MLRCQLPPARPPPRTAATQLSQATTTTTTTQAAAKHQATNDLDVSSKEAISVKQFWKCYNIRNAVDLMVKAWNNISDATIRHAWENLLATDKTVSSDSSQIQRQADLLTDAVTSITTVPAPGFCDVNENDIMKELLEEKVDASEAIENLIKEDVEEEAEQPDAIPEPPSLSVQQLSEALGLVAKARDIVHGKVENEALQEAFEHLNSKIMGFYNSKLNEQKQSTITSLFKMRQRVADVIENVTEDEGPIDLDSLDSELPEGPPFEGFDADTDGAGCSGENIRKEMTRLGSEGGQFQ